MSNTHAQQVVRPTPAAVRALLADPAAPRKCIDSGPLVLTPGGLWSGVRQDPWGRDYVVCLRLDACGALLYALDVPA